MPSGSANGRYWLGTLPIDSFIFPSPLPETVTWFKGQQEKAPTTGYIHVQCIAGFKRNVRLASVKRIFGSQGHWELTRSDAADAYVHKDETHVPGTRFELGAKALKRNSATDWDLVRSNAKSGNLDAIPADVFVRCYSSLTRIASDFAVPVAISRTVHVFWGRTGTGKSRRAWEEAGMDAYPKDPRTKWWCGYSAHENVVIDEFRGSIDIAHLLRWFDRYPVSVEIKGGRRPLHASRIWITSNLSPAQWYPECDPATIAALERRLIVEYFE